jgi:transcriptional regulator with XRE-family HTH domain
MPERSFGRTIRYRRTKLGLSQAKLGELVGRSASTIRAWERDSSLPNDGAVITALSAVLAVDRRSLFEKAGLEIPLEETSPTLEEAFASLGTEPRATVFLDPAQSPGTVPRGDESEIEVVIEPELESEIEPETEFEAKSAVEAEVELDEPTEWKPDEEPYPIWEPRFPEETLVKSTPVVSNSVPPSMPAPTPAFVEPPDPFVLAAPTPPLVEPSYMEDTAQRQLYRVRNLATIVLLVGMGIVFLWALSSTFDALGSWWEDFIGTLKL